MMECCRCENWIVEGQTVFLLNEYLVVENASLESFPPDNSGLYCLECLREVIMEEINNDT